MSDKLRKILTNNIVNIAEALGAVKCPGKVVSDNISTAAVKVGEGNILKIHVAADTYVAFSDDSAMPAVTATTTPAVLLVAGVHYVISSGSHVRASANPTRIELLEI